MAPPGRGRVDFAPGAVKPAVAQHDALHRRRFEDLPLERGDALHGHALQPVSTQVQWMVFAIWLGAWSIDPGDALRDQATRASLTSRRDQIAGALVANAGVAEERSVPFSPPELQPDSRGVDAFEAASVNFR